MLPTLVESEIALRSGGIKKIRFVGYLMLARVRDKSMKLKYATNCVESDLSRATLADKFELRMKAR